jgi:hypothetical protein
MPPNYWRSPEIHFRGSPGSKVSLKNAMRAVSHRLQFLHSAQHIALRLSKNFSDRLRKKNPIGKMAFSPSNWY